MADVVSNEFIVQLAYIIAAGLVAGAGSVLSYMWKSNRDLAVLKEQVRGGVQSVTNISEKMDDNTKLTMDMSRAVSALAPVVTQNADALTRYAVKTDEMSEMLIAVRYAIRDLRTSINATRAKYGMELINYPKYDVNRPEAVPAGPRFQVKTKIRAPFGDLRDPEDMDEQEDDATI